MHQTSTGRKAIYIPHSVLAMSLDELASRLAAAVCGLKDSTEGDTSDPAADAAWHKYAEGVQRLRRVLTSACESDELQSLDPMFHTPCSPDEAGAVALVDEVARYLVIAGVRVRITRHPEALAFIGLHPDELVRLDDVPMLVASAMYDPETDSEWHGLQRLVTEKSIYSAASLGAFAMLDERGGPSLSVRTSGACATAGDLCKFFEGSRQSRDTPVAQTLPEPVEWNGHVYQPGPEPTPEEVEESYRMIQVMQNPEDYAQPIPEAPFTRGALIEAYSREWPTIERDIRDAAANGLAIAAKAGARGWNVSKALAWARSRNKLSNFAKPADPLTQAMSHLTGRKHRIEG